MRSRVLGSFFALFVALSFVGGPLLHSIVPHNHGMQDACEAEFGYGHCPPGSAGEESGLWQFIHQSIAHEEKSVALSGGGILLVVLALIVAGQAVSFVPIERIALSSYEIALARGRYRFRAFG